MRLGDPGRSNRRYRRPLLRSYSNEKSSGASGGSNDGVQIGIFQPLTSLNVLARWRLLRCQPPALTRRLSGIKRLAGPSAWLAVGALMAQLFSLFMSGTGLAFRISASSHGFHRTIGIDRE